MLTTGGYVGGEYTRYREPEDIHRRDAAPSPNRPHPLRGGRQMNGDVTRYESDHLKATAGYGTRKRNLQLVFFDGKFPRRSSADEMTVEEQTVDALERVETDVRRAELEMDDVLRTTVYTTAADRIDDIESAYDTYFESRRPAMTVVGVADLPDDAAVQIEATAVER